MRAFKPDAPPRCQPTWFLCRLASVAGGRSFLADMRFAIKERRTELLADLAALDRAEAALQTNINFDIRRAARLTRRLAASRAKVR